MAKDLETFPPPPFTGFGPKAFGFFEDLAENQDKAWMAEHKAVYEAEVKAPMAALVAALSDRLAEDGPPLRGDPARSIFRLNRDVRFSKSKDPYKTHASFVMTRDGDKRSPGVLYVHVDPKGCFMAAGFFQPESDVLAALRRRLVAKPDAWLSMETALRKAKLTLDTSDTLTRNPKGFEAPPEPVATAVKLKSWIVRRDLTRKGLGGAGIIETLADFASAATPLLDFGWAALHGLPPSAPRRR